MKFIVLFGLLTIFAPTVFAANSQCENAAIQAAVSVSYSGLTPRQLSKALKSNLGRIVGAPIASIDEARGGIPVTQYNVEVRPTELDSETNAFVVTVETGSCWVLKVEY